MSTTKDLSIIVKWNGKEYLIKDINYQDTVAMLKQNIAKLTNVQPERQKLLNLRYKGKAATDDLRLCSLELKPHFKLMMIGSLEADMKDVQDSDPTRFDDLCDNVIDLIMYRLELKDLVKISDVSKRLRNIAGSVFSRKYGNCLISLDHFPKDVRFYRFYESHLTLDPHYKEKRMVRIGDSRAWFKLLRNFGESIKYIRFQYATDYNFFPNFFIRCCQFVLQYYSEYCADSVEVMEVVNCPFFLSLYRPLKKIQKLFIYRCNCIGRLEFNQNLHTLELSVIPKIIEKHFPHLENFSFSLNSSESVNSFISFSRMNRQIKKLTLYIRKPEHIHNDLIYSLIDENLTQLKKLKIHIEYFPHERNVERPTPNIRRFRIIDNFAFTGHYYQRMRSFEFNNLRKLTLGGVYSLGEEFNFILRHKNLKKIKLNHFCRYDSNIDRIFRRIFRELRDLVKVVISSVLKEQVPKWKSMFGIEWECMEEIYKKERIKLKFFKKA